ncbi:cytochrome P450 [Lactarius quietus]|nr:cytochrome P450 [Lactarius quietus]
MPLAVLNSFILLHRTLDRMSPLDFAIFVLFTSFASYQCFHHLKPRLKLPPISLLFVVPALLSTPISYHVLWPSVAVLLAFVGYGSAVTSSTLMYRLSPLHPLAKYPGPAIAKTSKLWAAYVCAKGDLHRRFKSLHDHYGDVMRVGRRGSLIGPNELSIRDTSLIHPILGKGGLPKGPRWEVRESQGPPTVIAQRDPILHMQQRKPWNRAFSSTAMKEYEIIVAKRVRQLMGCLEDMIERSDEKASAVVDMTLWLKFFRFGGGFELMKAGREIDGFGTFLKSTIWDVPTDCRLRAVTCTGITSITSHVPWVVPLFAAVARKHSTFDRARDFYKRRILARLRMGANRKDLLYHLSGEELPESERPPQAQVVQNAQFAVIAG